MGHWWAVRRSIRTSSPESSSSAPSDDRNGDVRRPQLDPLVTSYTRAGALRRIQVVLTAAIVVVHVLVSLMLILLILLHSGRGGGLSDMFGGGMGTPAAGSTVM